MSSQNSRVRLTLLLQCAQCNALPPSRALSLSPSLTRRGISPREFAAVYARARSNVMRRSRVKNYATLQSQLCRRVNYWKCSRRRWLRRMGTLKKRPKLLFDCVKIWFASENFPRKLHKPARATLAHSLVHPRSLVNNSFGATFRKCDRFVKHWI